MPSEGRTNPEYLESATKLFAAEKAASVASLGLRSGDAALDVGCGRCDDVALLAQAVAPDGFAVGLDSDPSMVEIAQGRIAGIDRAYVFLGEASAMPFDDDAFAAARVERALQHMVEPELAVAEMARVVRPGGRIAAAEPDWNTLALAGADRATTAEVLAACTDGIPTPDAGRHLARWFRDAGLDVLRVEAVAMPMLRLDVAASILELERAVAVVGTPAARAWLDDLRELDARGGFVAAGIGFGVLGRVPTGDGN